MSRTRTPRINTLMRISEIIVEGYKKGRKCKTPDAVYSSKISKRNVKMSVKTPFELDLTDKEADDLEADLHYAIEKVLAPLFKKKN